MTPHNEAGPGDYAEAVLLPGCPERAQWIAETLLEEPRRVNAVRGELGFTGRYRGLPVSVQATGMGRPSLAIYVHELVTGHGVKRIVRVGTCGGLEEDVPLRSVVIARSAAMDQETGEEGAWHGPDERLFAAAAAQAQAAGIGHQACPMVSSDVFYHPDPLGRFAAARALGARACDMETAWVLSGTPRLGARALSICTVVDNLVTGTEIDMAERQGVFEPMARLALETLYVDSADAG